MIGVPKNEIQWIPTPTVDMACKMITLIYISRCQKDSQPLIHMHYTGTIFSYKPFIGEFDFVPHTEIFNWLVNLQSYGNKIPRSLLFAKIIPIRKNIQSPFLNWKLLHNKMLEEKKCELIYLSTILFIVLVINWIS